MNYELAKQLKDAGFPPLLKGRTNIKYAMGAHWYVLAKTGLRLHYNITKKQILGMEQHGLEPIYAPPSKSL